MSELHLEIGRRYTISPNSTYPGLNAGTVVTLRRIYQAPTGIWTGPTATFVAVEDLNGVERDGLRPGDLAEDTPNGVTGLVVDEVFVDEEPEVDEGESE